MSHLSAEACVQRLAVERGDGYHVMGISLQQQQLARSTVHIERPIALDDRSSGEAAS